MERSEITYQPEKGRKSRVKNIVEESLRKTLACLYLTGTLKDDLGSG